MSVTFAHAEPSIAGVGDYIELMKPRVMSSCPCFLLPPEF